MYTDAPGEVKFKLTCVASAAPSSKRGVLKETKVRRAVKFVLFKLH